MPYSSNDIRKAGLLLTTFATIFIATAERVQGQNAPVNNPTKAFEEMFETFANNAGPLAPMFGKLSPDQLAKLDRIKVSINDESKFGQRVLDAYLQQLATSQIAVTQQGKDIDYLQQLLKTIKPQMRNGNRYRQFDVRVIEADSSDAYSIPGGHILVTRGLLETGQSEAAIVGVLSHELSHLDRGHQLIPLKQSVLAKQPLNFNDGMMWISLIARPIRPEQETEADSDATQWMMATGYDAKELAKLLIRWDTQQDNAMPWMKLVPGFVKSHPDAGKRAQAVLMTAAQLQRKYPNANFIGVDNLQLRTAR